MDIAEYLQLLANPVVRQIPTLVIAGLGFWFAVKRRRSLGRVSLWAAWGFGLLIVSAFISVLLQYLIVNVQVSEFSSGVRVESINRLSWLALAAHPIFIAAFAALARAVFLDRKTEREVELRQQSLSGIA